MSIQSTGIGSGLDVNSLISGLIQVESQPLATLNVREASYQAKLSAYGTLNSGLASFQNSISSLTRASTFQSLTATAGDSTVLNATASSVATAGSYNVNVTKIAQAQSISSAGQVSSTASIGSGTSTTITFQFGTISGTPSNGVYPPSPATTFAQDATLATGTVTIDSSNNSLQGIRDAINAANIGVTASIVGDGSAAPYHLVLSSAKTGANSSLKITASGDAALQNLLNYDPEGSQNFTEVVSAQNAALTINGIAISSASNSITSAIQGVTINATKTGTSTLSVAASTSAIQSSITSFVSAYNDLNSAIRTLTAYDPSTRKGGLLLGDSATQNIQNQLRSALSSAVNGLSGGFTNLSQIGITFQRDGSLAVDSTRLTNALSTNLRDVSGLFAAVGQASDSLVTVAGSSSATKGGSYALNVTQLATQGNLTGDLALGSSTTIDPNTTLNVTLDGVSASVSLAAGTYTPTQLAALVQSSINGVSAFSSAGSSISATVDGSNHLVLLSTKYGSSSNINIANGTGTTASSLTGTILSGTAGLDVKGTLGGFALVGTGQTLSGTAGTDIDGIQVVVAGGSTGSRGTINFSRGYADRLNNVLTGFLGTTGLLASTTNGINSSIADIARQRTVLNERLADSEARYRAQFTALDSTISSLNSTSAFLTQQLATLSGANLNRQ